MNKLHDTSCVREIKDEIFFCEDLLERNPEIFFHCRNNLNVQEDLVLAGVLLKGDQAASGCNFKVVFPSKKSGIAFVKRLNAYIKRLENLM